MSSKAIEERTSCPLGSTCKEVGVDNGVQFISKCAWLVSMKGTDASGNEHNDERCSMAWQPILQLEVSGTNRGINSAISSLRDTVQDSVQGRGKIDNFKEIKGLEVG